MPLDPERKRRLDRERIAAKRAVIREQRRRKWEELNPWIAELPSAEDVFRDVPLAEDLFRDVPPCEALLEDAAKRR